MGNVKTAISLPESLWQEVKLLAKQQACSRSELVAKALASFVESHRNQELLEQWNRAYEIQPDPEEQTRQRQAKKRYHRIVEGTW